ncbi:MAG: sulfatase [Opitutales bacterium]
MTPKPRNLLLVMVDDLNLALACYGHPAVHTPNLDRLAARGLRFERAFCPYPLCGPSRSALLTGQRPEAIPMPNNEVSWRERQPDVKSLPEIARGLGYHTERIGKVFHHGVRGGDSVDHQAQGFRLPHTHSDPESFVHEWGDAPGIYETQAEGPEQLIDGPAHGGTALHTIRATNPEVLPDSRVADRAEAFLRGHDPETPFFLCAGFYKPHVPFVAPEKCWAHYDRLEIESLVPPTWYEAAEVPTGTLKQERRFHRGASKEQRRHLYQGYLACVSFMDEQLGRVLDALDAAGRADDTLVAFVADHGYHIGEQAQWDKMMLLDPSLQIPMILAGPGIPCGETCGAVIESLDLFPTLARLMGWPVGEACDGKDLGEWIADPQCASVAPAFAWVQAGSREGWTIRTETHRYGLMKAEGAEPKPFLFDVSSDPHESRNLAGSPEQTELQDVLDTRLREHFRASQPIR